MLKSKTERFLNSDKKLLVFCGGVNKIMHEFPRFLSGIQEMLKFKIIVFLNTPRKPSPGVTVLTFSALQKSSFSVGFTIGSLGDMKKTTF